MSELCVVCQDELHNGEPQHALQACGHVFHTDCVMQWFRSRQSRCPLCGNGGDVLSEDSSEEHSIRSSMTEARKFAKTAQAPAWLKMKLLQIKKLRESIKEAGAKAKFLKNSIVMPGITHKKAHNTVRAAVSRYRTLRYKISRHQRYVTSRVRIVPLTIIKRIRPPRIQQERRASARLAAR